MTLLKKVMTPLSEKCLHICRIRYGGLSWGLLNQLKLRKK